MTQTATRLIAGGIALGGAAMVLSGSVPARGLTPWGGSTDERPPVPVPIENPITESKRVLGKILFWDEQLSSDNTMACATCHMPGAGGADPRSARNPGFDGLFFTDDDVFGSPAVIRSDANDNYVPDPVFGFGRQVTGRTAISVIGAAHVPEAFWDGRASGTFIDPQTGRVSIATGGALESQVVGPPASSVEMGHEGRSWDQITRKLAESRPLALATDWPDDVARAIRAFGTYPSLFEVAFGDSAITAERIAFAIATYERTLIADQTPWDAYVAGQRDALTPMQVRGLESFYASRCAVCHQPPLFTDQKFRNIGVRPADEDRGRQAVGGDIADRGKFKVPTLRNVGLKATFMHNGQLVSLLEVLAYYVGDQTFPSFLENRDPVMDLVNTPPTISPAIYEFLKDGLTDPRVAMEVSPFDHPTLYSQRGSPNVRIVGPSTSGSGGVQPRMIANVPPNVGNAGFKIGVHGGLGGAMAHVYLSYSPPVDGAVEPDAVIGTFVLAGDGAGAGYSTMHWPIPPDPSLDGTVVYMQWAIDDPAGAGGAGGVSRSEAVAFELFCGERDCRSGCYADCDASTGDGVLDTFDFRCFQSAFIAGDPYACECDTTTGPGVCDIFDFLCFQEAFVAGCR